MATLNEIAKMFVSRVLQSSIKIQELQQVVAEIDLLQYESGVYISDEDKKIIFDLVLEGLAPHHSSVSFGSSIGSSIEKKRREVSFGDNKIILNIFADFLKRNNYRPSATEIERVSKFIQAKLPPSVSERTFAWLMTLYKSLLPRF